MKILVTGSRYWMHDRIGAISSALEAATAPGDIVIHGGAPGVDTLSDEVANKKGLRTIRIMAEWDRLGKKAGPIRNREMLDLQPDIVLAFHDNLGESRGTKDCAEEAVRRGIPVAVYD